MRTILSTGLMIPNTLLTCATETNFVFSLRSPLKASVSSVWSSRKGICRNTAFLRSQSICHGTMLEWCSTAETIISSPSSTHALGSPPFSEGVGVGFSPRANANALILSVVPLVKIISSLLFAPMNSATAFRASSCFIVATWLR